MADRDPYPSEKQDRFIVRLPDGMRDRIKAAAEANNRSMNAEIVATLEEKYPITYIDVETTRSWEWLAFIDAATSQEERLERLRMVNDGLRFSKIKSRLRVRLGEDSDAAGELQLIMLPWGQGGDYSRFE